MKIFNIEKLRAALEMLNEQLELRMRGDVRGFGGGGIGNDIRLRRTISMLRMDDIQAWRPERYSRAGARERGGIYHE